MICYILSPSSSMSSPTASAFLCAHSRVAVQWQIDGSTNLFMKTRLLVRPVQILHLGRGIQAILAGKLDQDTTPIVFNLILRTKIFVRQWTQRMEMHFGEVNHDPFINLK